MYRYKARALSGYIGDDRLERTNSFDCFFFVSLLSLSYRGTCQRDIFMQMNRKGSMAFRTGKYFLSLVREYASRYRRGDTAFSYADAHASIEDRR